MNFLIDLMVKGIKRVVTIVVMVFSTLFGLFVVFMLIGIFALAVGGFDEEITTDDSYVTVAGESGAGNKVLSIPIQGIILGESQDIGGFFESFVEGIAYGYDIKDQLQQAAEDDDIGAVILEIDSPGGTIFGSVAIADGIQLYKEQTGNPVYAYVGGMAASGGYWAAAGADTIIADSGTAIGSIGVISGPFKYYDGVTTEGGGLFMPTIETTNGIQTNYITAGEYKDIGNPYREMTEEERTTLQRGADNAYDQFVQFVARQRELSAETVRDNVKALIYDEVQAQQLGLIDEVGNQDEAYELVAGAAGLSEYEVVRKDTAVDVIDAVFGASYTFIKGGLPKAKVCTGANVLAYHGDLQTVCSL